MNVSRLPGERAIAPKATPGGRPFPSLRRPSQPARLSQYETPHVPQDAMEG